MAIAKDILEKYRLSGRIAAEVRDYMKRTVSEGMPIMDVCEKAESLIRKKGGEPAFPCNVSVNEVAAHYTSSPDDKRTIPSNSIVKVDIGVHVEGYIADTAVTVCFNPEYDILVQTAEEALEAGIKTLRPTLPVSRFGSVVQKTIENRGCKVISNLTGHQLGRYLLHSGKSLPNISHLSMSKVNEGEVFAAEPFVTVTEAVGRVESGREAYIFRFLKHKSPKSEFAKQLLDYIFRNFHTLPFTERWIQGVVRQDRYKKAFLELLSSRALMSYPIFVEASGKAVAQAEHTLLVTKEGCEVLTRAS
jgi:methionyl aminopeptidase